MNIVLLRFGGEKAISVYGVLMYVDSFVQPLLYGMCDSLQPAVGYNWGAGNTSRVKVIEKCCFSASAIVSVASAIIIFLIPEQLTNLFINNGDGEFVKIAVGALKLFSLTYITRWFSFAAQSFMVAVDKPLPATYISVSTALVFPVILIILLWPLGLTGIWLNFAITSVLAAILSAVVLMKFRRELSHG